MRVEITLFVMEKGLSGPDKVCLERKMFVSGGKDDFFGARRQFNASEGAFSTHWSFAPRLCNRFRLAWNALPPTGEPVRWNTPPAGSGFEANDASNSSNPKPAEVAESVEPHRDSPAI